MIRSIFLMCLIFSSISFSQTKKQDRNTNNDTIVDPVKDNEKMKLIQSLGLIDDCFGISDEDMNDDPFHPYFLRDFYNEFISLSSKSHFDSELLQSKLEDLKKMDYDVCINFYIDYVDPRTKYIIRGCSDSRSRRSLRDSRSCPFYKSKKI